MLERLESANIWPHGSSGVSRLHMKYGLGGRRACELLEDPGIT